MKHLKKAMAFVLFLAVVYAKAEQPPANPKAIRTPSAKRNWGPEQATGAPDTLTPGDIPTAWAPLASHGTGIEWLKLDFDRPVEIREVRIRETFNPGTICKVVAIIEREEESVLWEGREPPSTPPTEFVVTPNRPVTSNHVKIYLDRTRVPGWNEIDAVELVGTDGTRQWAAHASASSTFAEQPANVVSGYAYVDEFNQFLQRLVQIHLEADGGEVVTGVLTHSGQRFLVIRNAETNTIVLVNKEKIVYVEVTENPPDTSSP